VITAGPIALALASAGVHAGWNLAFGRLSRNQEAGVAATAVCCGVLVWTPVAVASWSFTAAALPWAAASAAAELGYVIMLGRLYRHQPVERGYPVARGLAPAGVLAVSAALGAAVTGAQALGVVAVCAGVLLTARVPAATDLHRSSRLPALAAPVSCCIATYTLLDAAGVRRAGPAAYLWVTMAPVAAVLLAGNLRSRGLAAGLGAFRSGTAWLTGAGIFLAYGLTLLALARATPAQVPVVAAVRETSVVLLPLLAWGVARTRLPARVVTGSWVILAGLLLIRGA